jgi:hypothetical protein
MAIKMNCTCGRHLRVGDKLAGRRVQCPACGAKCRMPTKHGWDEPDWLAIAREPVRDVRPATPLIMTAPAAPLIPDHPSTPPSPPPAEEKNMVLPTFQWVRTWVSHS